MLSKYPVSRIILTFVRLLFIHVVCSLRDGRVRTVALLGLEDEKLCKNLKGLLIQDQDFKLNISFVALRNVLSLALYIITLKKLKAT